MATLVSVIVPVYNMGSSLESAMRSVLAQDYADIELILVDDGSKDDSYAICLKIAESDTRVRCIHTENQGSGPARNTGIAASRGKYLYFPDADDFLEPHAISTLVRATEGGKYDMIVFGYKTLAHTGELVYNRTYEPFSITGDAMRADYSDFFGMSSRYSVQGAPWNKFFDGDIVRKYGIEYPALRRHQDEGFISRYVTHCKHVRFLPDQLYIYYANTVSLMWKKYPVDYVDAVTGLRDVWHETVCKWNPEDARTHLLVEAEILNMLVRVLELSYSPKMEFGFLSRHKWLKETCRRTDFGAYPSAAAGSLYQKLLLLCAKWHLYLPLHFGVYIGNLKNKLRQGS